MKTVKLCAWFLLGLFLGGVATFASAETLTATKQAVAIEWLSTAQGVAKNFSSCSEAAAWTATGDSYGARTCPAVTNVIGQTYNFCQGTWCNAILGNVTTRCPSGSVNDGTGSGCVTTLVACPANKGWTLSGMTCTRPDCVAPEVRDPADGICKAPPCPAAGKSGAAFGATGIFTGSGSIPSFLCVNGCQYDTGGVGVEAGGVWATGIGRSTGATCTTNTGSALSSGDPQTNPKTQCVESGQAFGTVNGVVVCVPATTTTTKGSGSTTTTNKDPQGNTTSTSTTSTSTSSTSTTNIGGGGSTRTTTTTTTNPDGSTTITTTTGEGVGDGEGEDNEDYDWGRPPEEGPLSERSIGPSSITPVSMGGSGACPAPIALPHDWGSVSYQPACDLAGMIKPITLAFAWLAAVLIAVGGFKDA